MQRHFENFIKDMNFVFESLIRYSVCVVGYMSNKFLRNFTRGSYKFGVIAEKKKTLIFQLLQSSQREEEVFFGILFKKGLELFLSEIPILSFFHCNCGWFHLV
uniref:Uncharacterized protein n=1 Tax=Cacopsylla melanoneura TaxID=428564 RepID=A0A8D8QX75_9HEMI